MKDTTHAMEAEYVGELRCMAQHLASGNTMITDAPTDNQGKGEAFSPTDLLCTSLATCMMTIMGIAARERKIHMEGSTVKITKVMAANPRRVHEIHLSFMLVSDEIGEKELDILKHAAHTCPVALSIHPDIQLLTEFATATKSEA
ncbi:MAG: OsmC family protein [Flavobacteriales bacterium]